MAEVQTFTKQLGAANAALLAASQMPVSGTPLTLTGTAIDTARRILLTFGSEAAARTMLITGTNYAGTPISEVLAIPMTAAGTVATLQDFFTVTAAMPLGGGWTAAVTLGTNTIGSSPWWLADQFRDPVNIGLQYDLLSGAQQITVETTLDPFLLPLPIYAVGGGFNPALGGTPILPIPTPLPVPSMQNISQNAQGAILTPVHGVRLTVNSGTGQGRLTIRQAGAQF